MRPEHFRRLRLGDNPQLHPRELMQMNIDLSQFSKCRVLVFGDYMVDEYVIGSVDRISPEAPVPVLRAEKRRLKLGGAGNVVDGLIALNATVRVCGLVGEDTFGEWIRSRMDEAGVDINNLIQSPEVTTTVKSRFVSRGQQFLRCDTEEIIDEETVLLAFQSLDFNRLLDTIDVVLISDYAKGAVTEHSASKLIQEAAMRGIATIIDPKGSNYEKYRGATGCTPNRKELSAYYGKPIATESDEGVAAQAMIDDCGFRYVYLTRSEKGISVFDCDGKRIDFPAEAKEVVDVSGAGDTVACIVSLGLATNQNVAMYCTLANKAASIACSKQGTTTVSIDELQSALRNDMGSKLCSFAEAMQFASQMKEEGKRIVFTNGCFDLLHYGHISSFKQARELGDALIVAVNSDESVRRLKGPNRPIINEHDRLGMIAAISCVDRVLLMRQDNPRSLIEGLKPDIIVKGKDWKQVGVPEASLVESYGGKVVYIDMAAGLSTTNIIDRVVSRYAETD